MNSHAAPPTRLVGMAIVLVLLGLTLVPMQAYADGPFYYYPLTPCRFVDTRDPTLQGGHGQLPRFTNVPFTAKGHCGIPLDAKASDEVWILANNHPIARGEIQISDEKISIAVTRAANVYDFMAGGA